MYKIQESSVHDLETINELLKSLSQKAHHLSEEQLQSIIDNPNTHLYILYNEVGAVGMLTLAKYLVPTGVKWWIEDVVVSSTQRGKGLGRALMQHALNEVKKQGGGAVLLTSRPSREVANKMYQRMGFERRETNVYKILI